MISYLSGQIKFLWEKEAIINVNWVWYKLWITSDFSSSLKIWEEKEIWIHTAVRETEIALFWFSEKNELDFFEILIKVNWVGPKTALEILSLSIEKLKMAISSWDIPVLKQIKWIGQKAAERIIVELKNKIWTIEVGELKNKNSWSQNEILEDAIMALESLWFKKWEIVKKIRNAPELEKSEDLVTWFLSGK